MNVLVTGGSGNIGSVVVGGLEAAGHAVRIFDLKAPRARSTDFVQGSVTAPKAVEDAATGMDAIVHLAAIPAFRPEIAPVDFMHVNVTGTFNVLEAAGKHDVAKVVFASSDSALGFVFGARLFSPEYFPIDEFHPLRPQDPYGLSKLLGEELCRSASRKQGTHAICLRFCWVWFDDTYSQRAAILGGDPKALAKTMWGHVSVHDAAQACRLAVEASSRPGEHEVFFITADDTYADRPSLELIRAHYPEVRSVSNVYLEEAYKGLFDISQARKRLGYAPRYTCRRDPVARALLPLDDKEQTG
jgi:nucleoside-diphosphate-sugar epimerase